jgi:uncharacterized membrane protein
MAHLSSNNESRNIFLRLHPIHRILISLAVAFLALLAVSHSELTGLLKTNLAWDVFALAYVILCWIVFFNRSAKEIRVTARKEDGSRVFVSFIIIIAAFASLLAVLLLITSDKTPITPKMIYVPLTVVGMLLSWVMVHTVFGFHYANMYYDDEEGHPEKHAGGLEFPNEKAPDYLDFAYFSFVIGMTFQVSDVQITSKKIRRQALAHGLLSFGLNTFVVALTINLIAGLKS